MYESPMNSAIEYEYYWQFAPDVFLASSQNEFQETNGAPGQDLQTRG
jgi:hypothetical protein